MQKGYTCLKFTLGGEARGEHVNTFNTAFERWVLRRTLTKLMYYRFVHNRNAHRSQTFLG